MFIAMNAPKNLAPLGAKPGREPLPRQAKAIALLRSFEVTKGPPGYKHLAPLGRSDKQRSVAVPTRIRDLRLTTDN